MTRTNDAFLHSNRAIIFMALQGSGRLTPKELAETTRKAIGRDIFSVIESYHSHLRIMEDLDLVDNVRGKDKDGRRRGYYRLTERGRWCFEYMQLTKQQFKQGNTEFLSMGSEKFERQEIFAILPFRQLFLLSLNDEITSVPSVVKKMGQAIGKAYKPDIGLAGRAVKPLFKKKMVVPIPDEGFSLYGHYGITDVGKRFLREGEKIELRLLNPSLQSHKVDVITAEEFDRKFDAGEDMTEFMDFSTARRPNREK